MQLNDKTALVTASGIGKEIARQFVVEGPKVASADLNLQAACIAANELDPSGASTTDRIADPTLGPGKIVYVYLAEEGTSAEVVPIGKCSRAQAR